MVDHAMASRITTLRPALFAFLMSRCHCLDTADEVCQEACLKLLKIEIVPEDGEQSFTKYAFTVANSCLNDYFRKRKRIDKESRGGSDDTLLGVAKHEDNNKQQLPNLIAHLQDRREREAVMLLCCDYTTGQIATALNISQDNVYQILSRATRKLKEFARTQHDDVLEILEDNDD